MAGVKVTWTQDTDPNVASYSIFFTVTPAGSSAPNPTLTLSVPRSTTGDAGGYSADYLNLTPTPPALNNGDSLAVTGESIDTFGQASPMVPAAGSPVVISIAPPPPPPPTGPTKLAAAQS